MSTRAKGPPLEKAGWYVRQAQSTGGAISRRRGARAHQRTLEEVSIRYVAKQEGESFVRALMWLLRGLLGWHGPILERNPAKRARAEVFRMTSALR